MTIKLVSRETIAREKMDKAVKRLEALQEDIINQIRYAITCLVDLEYLYDMRDFIDGQIENWTDEEIELDDDFFDDEE